MATNHTKTNNEPGKCQYCGKERTANDGHVCEPMRFSKEPFCVTGIGNNNPGAGVIGRLGGFSLPDEDGDAA